MKKILFLVFGMVLVQSVVFAETYNILPEQSEVKWTASKVTGKHFGKISVASGTVEFEGDVFIGGEAVINTNSLTVEDLQGDGKAKLEGHLKSADFFSADEFPAASIKITGVEPAGDQLYNVTADLTIKNITKPVQFQAKVTKTDAGVESSAKITVDRTAYDIRYGSGKFFENLGDKTIHDEFTLEVSVKAAA